MVSIKQIDGRRRLVVEREVRAPTDTVWDVLVDTSYWPEWGPSVRAVDVPVERIERGTTGRVRIPGGLWVPFEVTVCEPYRWSWEVARIPATGHTVDPLGDGRCRVAFDMPLVAGGYAPVCRRALSRIANIVEGEEALNQS